MSGLVFCSFAVFSRLVDPYAWVKVNLKVCSVALWCGRLSVQLEKIVISVIRLRGDLCCGRIIFSKVLLFSEIKNAPLSSFTIKFENQNFLTLWRFVMPRQWSIGIVKRNTHSICDKTISRRRMVNVDTHAYNFFRIWGYFTINS